MSIKIRRQSLRRFYLGWVSLIATTVVSTPFAVASPTETPERETLRISKSLRPITDDTWKQVAGEQVTGKYDITHGDTLYDISKRLFGDARYWPKIWAMNNGTILNPHLIRPGNKIAFMPGTGTTLPSVSIETSDGKAVKVEPASMTDVDNAGLPPIPKMPPRSQEWKMLPDQPWEAARIEEEEVAKNEVTVMGSIDKVHTLSPTRELSVFTASQPVPLLGEIVSSPTVATYLRVGDQILIRGLSEEIKPGETYAVTRAPVVLEKDEKKRQGLAYHVDGEVQVVGIQNGYWIGLVKQGRGLMNRGAKLIPLPPRIKNVDPIPAPASKLGYFYVDKESSSTIAGQHSFGFVNLGSEDGLQEGMVLEGFQSNDQNTGAPLAYQKLFHIADMQVVQVSERFCTVRIIAGATEVYEGLPVHLLTDFNRFQKYGALPIDNDEEAPPAPAPEPTSTPTSEPSAEPEPVQSLDEPSSSASPDVPPPIPAPAPVPTPETAPTSAPTSAATPAPTSTAQSVQEQQAPPPPAPEPTQKPAPTPAPTKNELDALDGEDKLNANEERELKQLENYKAKIPETTTNAGAPPPPPSTTPPSTPENTSAAPTDTQGIQEF